jgi:16S rRNA (cytidine1402-2'-O)-methyltransferase
VLYESPYRIEKLLQELKDIYPDREVALGRELTKKFEEFLRGKPSALLQHFQNRTVKGEFVVLIAATGQAAEASRAADPLAGA